jgi:type I restriction enzyme S subunit
MSFPRYPKYKASGVEWLGDVPEGWEVRPLKTIASGASTLFIDGDWIESKDISKSGIRYLTSGNVGEGFYKEQGQGFITEETFNELKCTEVLPGDLLISRLNVPIGRACIVPDLGSRIVTCVDNVVVRPASTFNRQFCVFLLSCKGHLENTEILGRGATMPRLSRSVLGRLPFVFPPLPEQTAIAEFLDRETGKIDQLVAEQRRLMELLKEKRQAVISHAVTKGLNPHAPMKPSGIEWLGDVPVGWVTCALKRLVRMQSGESITAESIAETGNYPVYGGNGLRGFTSEFTHNGTYVLIGRQGALCGNINYASEKFWASEHAVVATPTKPVDTFWLGEMLRSMNLNQYSIAAAQPGLSVELVGRLGIPLPPLAEQMVIAAHLTKELAKFDTLTAEAQRAIGLLGERRSALISAAVTGQIDVRQQPWN